MGSTVPQSSNPSANPSISQPINQPTQQSVNPSISQPINQSTQQSANPINQPINHYLQNSHTNQSSQFILLSVTVGTTERTNHFTRLQPVMYKVQQLPFSFFYIKNANYLIHQLY